MSKKEWKSIAVSRKWGEISDELTADYLNRVLTYADEMHKFYCDYVERKRIWSIILRIGSVALFAVALILTLTISFTPDKEEFRLLTMNVGALVLASVLLLIDRQFGLSEGWMRYIQAQFEIEKVISEYQAQFISINLLNGTNEDLRKLQIDTILNLDKSLRTIIIDETSNWSTNLRNQITALTNKVDSELTSARQKLEQERIKVETKKKKEAKKEEMVKNKNSAEKGVLLITFNYKSIKAGNFAINDDLFELKQMQDSKVITNLEQGIYTIIGTIILEDGEIPIERVVKIGGGINEPTVAKTYKA
ncbi:MAG: SLATT domain-containing protein [Cyclobacteriaceae bacterium]|nr:SLATT domain-containing protein [Cyclobacteriaceae bacterium]